MKKVGSNWHVFSENLCNMDYASKKERNGKFHVHLMGRLLVSKGNLFAQIFRPSGKAYRYLGFNTIESESLIALVPVFTRNT